MAPHSTRAFRRQLYANLDPMPKAPIECDGPLYVPLYEGQHDPIAQLAKKIDLSGTDSIQFLSGCRGSGKTTELHRLARRLEEAGYVVFHADALEYLNPAEPVEITELLVVLGAALSEHVHGLLQKDPARLGYLNRLWDYFQNTEVVLDGFGLKAGTPSFAAEFKTTLRTTDSFRGKIRELLNGRTKELKGQLDCFVKDIKTWIEQDRENVAGVVFLFDSLEQLRGSTTNEDAVMTSVERLFTQHRELLRLAEVHVVYTVPPWLRYRAPGAVQIEKMLPCVKLWQYGENHERTASVHGWSVMRELVEKRVGNENLSALFGPPEADGSYSRLDELILNCGGHFRDLLFLIREAFVAAEDLEITDACVEIAVADLRGSFSMAESDANWLRNIHETQDPSLPDSEAVTVGRFTRFLDHHLVILFANGRDWYDIHPIITDDVFRVSDRLRAAAAAALVPALA